MKNLKVSKKLIISFGIVLLLFVVSVVVVVLGLNNIRVQMDSFYAGPWETRALSNSICNSIAEQQKFLYKAIATTDAKIITPCLAEVNEYDKKIQSDLALLEQNVQPSNRDKVTTLKNYINEWNTVKSYILELTADTSITSNEISQYMQENATEIVKNVTDSATVILDATQDMGDSMMASTNNAQMTTTLLLLVFCSISLVSGILLCAYITKSITRPLKEVEAAANQMLEGQLNISVHYTSKDELGSLANAMRKMGKRISYYMTELSSAMQQLAGGDLNVKPREPFLGDFKPTQQAIRDLISSLNDTLTQINQAADQVASGSDQVSSGSQALSQGTTEQASSIDQLAVTINEVSGQVQKSADYAVDANSKAHLVGEEMALSNQKMQEMIQAMGQIDESSKEIGKIIKTIEDIAFQTNILALNAAVEAARAGSAGKGFAVVADEVRNLATKSQEASKSTSVLIQSSLQAVGNGTKIADETAKSLLSAVEGAHDVAATIDKVSAASREQAISIEQVMQSVDQISSVVQTNSATAEESAAASEELSSQAQMLRKLVGRFQLKGNVQMTNITSPVVESGREKSEYMEMGKY